MMTNDYVPIHFNLLPKNNVNENEINIAVMPPENFMYDNSMNFNDNYVDHKIKGRHNNNAEENMMQESVKESAVHVTATVPLNMLPPPPHKIINNKNIMFLNSSRRGNLKWQRESGRSLSPMGYESDESCHSYSFQGNVQKCYGFKNKLDRHEIRLYDQALMFGKFSHSSPNMCYNANATQNNNFNKFQKKNKSCKHGVKKPSEEIQRRVYGLMERFTSRSKLFEINSHPPGLINGGTFDQLNLSIWDVFSAKAQKAETYVKKLQLWQLVYLHIRKVLSRYGLFMVGSTMSGLGTEDSDIDMCLLVKTCLPDTRSDAVANLEHIRDILANCVDPHVIPAKVPILKFRGAQDGFEVDLNCNNAVGIRNTHMLHCYAQLDWRVRPLVIIVKLWARANNINDAKKMTISSYSLALMVIHYLQCGVAPPVVPCLHGLHPGKFSPTSEICGIDIQEEPPKFKSDNKLSLGELLIGFLQYYSYFNYNSFAISVRMGSRLQIDECRFARAPKNDPHQWKFLCIEEPFDFTNTARSVYDPIEFKRIKDVFFSSYKILSHELNINCILNIEGNDQR